MAVKLSDSVSYGGGPISSRQVALILARAREIHLHGEEALLEWLEYTAVLGQYYRIEDLPVNKFQLALDKIAESKKEMEDYE